MKIQVYTRRKTFSIVCHVQNRYYNPFLVYCRELAPGTVSLTGDRAQGDDSKHDSHYSTLSLRINEHPY